MEELATILVAALLGGALAGLVRLPPLVGFLGAGFALHAAGMAEPHGLELVSDLGVALLLFGIGLKLDLRTLLRREVWLTATVHLAGSLLLGVLLLAGAGALGAGLLAGAGWRTYAVVALALSFSSTVFVVKLLDERGSGQSLGGRTAIAILIIQDLAAVVFLVATHGEPPSPWAPLLVLLVPAAWLFRRALAALGHDELRPLFGVTMALVPGFALFEAAGLHGDLGALVLGVLLASHPGAGELSKSLFSVKELLLVGFFLSIGFIGLPTGEHLLVALLLLLLLPVKAAGFAVLLWAMGLRRRTSVQAGTALANFSEFGLIVTVAMPNDVLSDDWLVSLATAIALSFTLAAAVAGRSEKLVGLARRFLPDRPPERVHPEDRPIDVSSADAVVLGIGRVGRGAYDRLHDGYGLSVIGVETVVTRVEHLRTLGYDVVEGDATDPEFWTRMRASDVDIVVLAMPFHGNNLDALEKLRASGFSGTVAVVAQYDADLSQSFRHGAHTGIQLYEGAGAELADRAAGAAGVAAPEGEAPGAGS
jgi:predicted Kef-type K+ transport protein